MIDLTILQGDCRDVLATLPDESVNCIVTSPPYWGLRSYLPTDHPDKAREIGQEATPLHYVATLVQVFRECWRVLCPDGTLWLNLGDCYANDRKWGGQTSGKHVRELHGDSGIGRRTQTGLPNKNLVGLPWRVAFALQDDGWILRSDIIWEKPNAMPSSVKDRPTGSHEYLFLFAKSERYHYDADAIREPALTAERRVGRVGQYQDTAMRLRKQDAVGKTTYEGFNDRYTGVKMRNKRSVWTINTQAYPGSHFAAFPEELIKPCILAGCPVGGVALDPFGGSGTVGRVALRYGRRAILIDLNPAYMVLQSERTAQIQRQMEVA